MYLINNPVDEFNPRLVLAPHARSLAPLGALRVVFSYTCLAARLVLRPENCINFSDASIVRAEGSTCLRGWMGSSEHIHYYNLCMCVWCVFACACVYGAEGDHPKKLCNSGRDARVSVCIHGRRVLQYARVQRTPFDWTSFINAFVSRTTSVNVQCFPKSIRKIFFE